MQNSVVHWLEYTARRFPEKTAFVDEKVSYTWAEVRRKVLSIAKKIEKIIPDGKQPVAVYMEKSADMLLAYLGIAYSGCFYSPIATDMPPARVEKILNTLQPAMFLVTRDIREEVGRGERLISAVRFFAMRILLVKWAKILCLTQKILQRTMMPCGSLTVLLTRICCM